MRKPAVPPPPAPQSATGALAAPHSPQNIGRIAVYSKAGFEELLRAVEPRSPPPSPPPPPPLRSTMERDQRLEERRREYERICAEIDVSTQRRLAEERQKKEENFQRTFARLQSEQRHFLPKIQRFFAERDNADQEKREALYQEWCTDVFTPIQARVQQQLESTDPEELNARKRQLFDAFLEATNRKEGLFRDIIIEQDYDPLAWKQGTIRYPQLSPERDPLKREMCKKVVEERLVSTGPPAPSASASPPQSPAQAATLGGTTRSLRATATPASPIGTSTAGRLSSSQVLGPLASRSRSTLDTQLWDRLECTPYYDRISDEAKRVDPNSSKKFVSQVNFDHYAFPRSKDAADLECAKGKKVYPDKGHDDLLLG
ncbi:hypothetical protein PAPYR_3120 [Paratrimastix pyriformis]|uniref:Uncharacterized protein n=1 Tax=Paratrimastix pyriformis TaxID=342808 RepID=A0ABQ8USJ9_9EUKA|nr:hypothetical protein PAPYR_3120 [Paratrimastix pyriformis]